MKKLNIVFHRSYFKYLIVTTDLLLALRSLKTRMAKSAAFAKLRPVRGAA